MEIMQERNIDFAGMGTVSESDSMAELFMTSVQNI